MSRRPAIGLRWIEKFWRDVYFRDFVVMKGREYKPPCFYDKWMEKNHPKIMAEVKAKRDLEAVWLPFEKLTAKEKIHNSRDALYIQRAKI